MGKVKNVHTFSLCNFIKQFIPTTTLDTGKTSFPYQPFLNYPLNLQLPSAEATPIYHPPLGESILPSYHIPYNNTSHGRNILGALHSLGTSARLHSIDIWYNGTSTRAKYLNTWYEDSSAEQYDCSTLPTHTLTKLEELHAKYLSKLFNNILSIVKW